MRLSNILCAAVVMGVGMVVGLYSLSISFDQTTTRSSASYDVLPDGDHFVVALTPQYPSPTHFNVVVNWFEELKRR